MRTAIDDLDEMGGWGVVASRFRPAQVPFGRRRGSILHPSPPVWGVRGVGYDPTLLLSSPEMGDGVEKRMEVVGCGKRNGKSQTSSTVVYSFNE